MGFGISEQNKRDAKALANKLALDAESLLVLIVTELRARGATAEVLPASAEIGATRDRLLLNGHSVPLWAKQAFRSGGYQSYAQDYLELRCNWVWDGCIVVMKTKTFSRSKGREATFGFDVAKVADHCLLWVKTHEEFSAKKELRDTTIEAWRKAEQRLVRKYPAAQSLLVATERGLVLECTVDERTAEKILELLKA